MKRQQPEMEASLTGTIVEWSYEKGYGFLQVGKERVFLHIHDFAEHHKRPAAGDRIVFVMGRDAKGRSCARNAVHVNDGGRITLANVLVLVGLLVLPAIALQRWAADWRWIGAYALAINALAYGAYAFDKRRARAKERRLAETRLHLLELLGGWPGAFLAQRRLRHKCSRITFQSVFWLIVLAYQFVAFDSLRNWQYARAALSHLERTAQHQR